jgi:membrane-associated HD superfamily phosphohydrolase
MTKLHESDLGQPLLAYVFAFYILTVIWAEIRRYHPQVVAAVSTLSEHDSRLLIRGRLYRSLIMMFSTIVFCFTLYPSIYKAFVPIKMLDTTLINVTGVILLIISLIWIVVAQSDFDSDIFSNEIASKKMSDEELALYSKKISAGYLIMFAGLTLTLANILSVLLLLFASGIHLQTKATKS